MLFRSPIEYYAVPGFKDEFKKLIESYYSPIAVFFHHYSLAKNFWEDLKDKEEFKLKSYFYLIRSLLSCNWIIKDKSVLPMEIEGLMKYVDEDFKEVLRKLILLKGTVGEKYLHSREDKLNERILNLFKLIESSKESLVANKADMSLPNEFFLKMLYGKADG